MLSFSLSNRQVDFPPKDGTSVYFFDNSTIGPVHYLSNFSIRYLLKGRVETHIGRRRAILEPGMILFVPPGAEVRSQSLGSVTGISVFMSAELYGDFAARMPLADIVSAGKLYPTALLRNLSVCLDGLIGSPNAIDHNDIFSNVIFSLDEDVREMNDRLSRIERKKLATRLDVLCRLEHARHHMESNVSQKFSLAALADRASMSKFSFLRSFKTAFHETPNQYLIALKISRAKELLRDGARVKDAAAICGYPDIFSFSKQFKAIEGHPPNQFKMLCR